MARASDRSWPDPEIAADLAALRAAAPLVHCVTNVVASPFTANLLLAIGAAPAMVHAPQEVADLVPAAGALLVNLGTVTAEQAEAARIAVAAAREHDVPWVLDPVAVGPLPFRTALAHELLEQRPTAIRGNPSEILALAGLGAGGRGVDATDGPEAAIDAARDLARRSGAAVAVSGAIDHVTDGERLITVPGGDELLTRVTGAGCALGALVAAACAVVPDPLRAAASASALLAAAAERAVSGARGPGSFAVGLLDELDALGR